MLGFRLRKNKNKNKNVNGGVKVKELWVDVVKNALHVILMQNYIQYAFLRGNFSNSTLVQKRSSRVSAGKYGKFLESVILCTGSFLHTWIKLRAQQWHLAMKPSYQNTSSAASALWLSPWYRIAESHFAWEIEVQSRSLWPLPATFVNPAN